MSVLSSIGVNIWILLVGMAGVFLGGIMLNWVNKTVGLNYAFKLFKMKNKINKDKILLKVWLPNGKPQYIIKPIANIIEYNYKENGKTKIGMVKYDYYSMYKEFSDIPVLECDPNDIVPRNPFVNTSLTISGEILKKNITDSAKEDLKYDDMKKWIKMALPIIIAVGIIVIIYSQNQADALAECTRLAISSREAIIQA